MASNPNHNSLKFLLFYQGEKGKRCVEHIIAYVKTHVVLGISIDPRAVPDADNTMARTIYDKMRGQIEESDVALAVLTPDDRWASEAGNLWLEIGHWLGSKRRACPNNGEEYLSSIMLLQQQKPARQRRRWRVQVVTNIGTGIPAPCFCSDAEIDKEVLAFLVLETQKRSHGQSLLSHEKKVLDTLGCSVNFSWSDQMDIL